MKKLVLSLFSFIAVSSVFAQIPNNGMETWGSTIGQPQEPTSYVSANVLVNFLLPGNVTSVTQGTGADAHSGNYSAKISTVKVTSNPSPGQFPDTLGVLLLGVVNTSPLGLKAGTPWTTRLASVDFFYKYTSVNNDNGAMIAYLTKWNGTTRDTIATAAYPINNTTSSFSQVSGPFLYDSGFPNTTTPDSLHVYFLSSARPWLNSPFVPNPAQVGSILWVDDATVTTIGLKETFKLGEVVKAYPNPATNYFTVSVANDDAVVTEIFDITGKKVATIPMDNSKVRINTEAYNEGLYIYSVKDKNNKVIATGKINVSK